MKLLSTTIIGVRVKGKVAFAGDGQVSLGETIMKAKATKLRRMYNGRILAGFAGSSADAFTLFERFEKKLEEFSGQLPRAAVELAKDWRQDKYLRHLQALLAVADKTNSLIITGKGDVVEPDDSIVAIGSGGPYALAAARALAKHTSLSAREIVQEAMSLAGQICIFTNEQIAIEEL